jgi:shikimate 5-dehydrogenase
MARMPDGGLYAVQGKRVPTFRFIGVTTGQSSIMKVFPLWVRELGHSDVAIEGVDLVPHDRPDRYRRVVAQIKNDPLSVGALITTHKIDLLDAAHDLFDELGPYARICGEVSCISKRGELLVGEAKDPITSGRCLDEMLGEGYFAQTGGEVLCFGAGGAATAIAVHLIEKADIRDRPRRFVVVNRSPGRLDRLRRIINQAGTDIAFELVCSQDPEYNNEVMQAMSQGSVVINATGMGKDRPGSPITHTGQFPAYGVAWELNYRGELGFYHQAKTQSKAKRVRVEDGWTYFLYGWTEVIAEVLDLELDAPTFECLANIAAGARGS